MAERGLAEKAAARVAILRRNRPSPAIRPEDVLNLLEEDQLFFAKRKPFGRMALSPGKSVILWLLRLYVVFMWIVVIVAALQSGH